MEKLVSLKTCSILIVITLLLTAVSTAQAVPTLQLYSDGAVYNQTTQSWMTYNNPFTLQVLGADQPNSLIYIDQVKLHIAVPSQYFNSLGTVTVEGLPSSLEGPFATRTYTASDFTYGVPVDLAGTSGNSRKHGIYDAYYVSVPIEQLQVDSHSDTIINYVDVATGQTNIGSDKGDIDLYRITYSNFYLIHMDLTGMTHYRDPSKNALEFAPFSHDADAPKVPEPNTLLLLGSGLLSLALYGRRKFRG